MVINANIRTKEEILNALIEVFDRTSQYCLDQDDDLFEKPIRAGKWSTAQNIDHLSSSTFPIAKAMAMPKLAMKMTFGTNNRDEKSIDELFEKYKKGLASGIKAPAQFEPPLISNDQKKETLSKFIYAKEKLIKVSEKWNEKSLSKYIIPHPAIGKLTIREMLFFTIFHTEHHLNTIKKCDFRIVLRKVYRFTIGIPFLYLRKL